MLLLVLGPTNGDVEGAVPFADALLLDAAAVGTTVTMLVMVRAPVADSASVLAWYPPTAEAALEEGEAVPCSWDWE